MDHSHTLSLVLILTLIPVLIQTLTLIADWPAAAALLSGLSKDQIL